MFWIEEKLNARIRELETYRYRDAITIEQFHVKKDPKGEIGSYPTEEGPWSKMNLGEEWIGRDAYLWLAANPYIPETWRDNTIIGYFDFGKTGGGNNSGFESLLFLDGEPYQGVDSNHKEVFLPPAKAGRTISLRFRLWSGLNGYDRPAPITHRLEKAMICRLDEAADDLYFTGKAALQTLRVLGNQTEEYQQLITALDRAFLLVDWSEPGSETFYASVSEARGVLQGELKRLPEKQSGLTVTCVGHTHIDVAWLWRLRHTREKAARSFSTVLRLMERYPEYLFLQTQPQLYEFIKSDYPALYDKIKAKVKERQWEAAGAMWLEADCNLPSGESLVRQILYGKRFLLKEFGVDCEYLWLPDVFGYSWALPQILRKSGISVFMTTKISWNQYNRMPHDTFYWKGIDGSEVLTHFITTPDPGAQEGSFYYTYNGVVTPETVQGIWKAYRDKTLNRNLLLAYGYGDGGGGVNRDMLEMRRRLENMPGLPNVVTGRADHYFAGLKQRVEASDQYVHTWDGELYLELHRGTYTSQAHVKKANRRLELALREAEWLQVMSALGRRDWSAYPASDLAQAWTIVLRNQFHDIIPGSSIREVYEDCREEYSVAGSIVHRVRDEAAYELVGTGQPAQQGDIFTLFNNASWDREDTVFIEGGDDHSDCGDNARTGGWYSANGELLPAQRTAGGWLVHVTRVQSMGYAAIEYRPGPSFQGESVRQDESTPFMWDTQTLHTPFYEITFNTCGQIARLTDKTANREVLSMGETGNVLQVFEDKPKSRHEAWDIDIYYSEKMKPVTELLAMELTESGPLRAVVRFEWRYRNSSVNQRMIVYAHSRRIDFDTTVEWHEQRQLLKTAFPVAVHANEAVYDIQFGNVKRPTHWNTSWDYARFETVGHQWADLSERNYGVSLLNDCKYGYDIKGNVMRLSLIKSAMVPDDTADQGRHDFTYALLPHQGDWYAGGTVQEAWALNNPMTWVLGAAQETGFSMFSLSADHVMIDAVKKAEDEDAVIVRLHEFAGARAAVVLQSGCPIVSWAECDLMERPLTDMNADPEIELTIMPYEIKTFMIRLK
ncbi:alpha-mannosidase [Paenibacillus tarimensis]